MEREDLIDKVRDALERADNQKYALIDPTPNYEAMATEIVDKFLRNGLRPGSITTHNGTTPL